MIAVLWALGASIGWGCADYAAGLQVRRSPLVVVLAVSQGVGLIGIAAVVALRGVGPPGGAPLAAALAAGLLGIAASLCFYRSLELGAMSVVAPITATSAAVPALVGAVRGEVPTALQAAGMALALAGCVLVSREGAARDHAARWGLSIVLAVAAMLLLGVDLVFIDLAAEHDALWAILIARAVAVPVWIAAVLVQRASLAEADLRLLALVGLIDTAANACYAIATTGAVLGVVAILASTYPVITVALAQVRLGERLGPVQLAGVVAALAGVAAIVAGA